GSIFGPLSSTGAVAAAVVLALAATGAAASVSAAAASAAELSAVFATVSATCSTVSAAVATESWAYPRVVSPIPTINASTMTALNLLLNIKLISFITIIPI